MMIMMMSHMWPMPSYLFFWNLAILFSNSLLGSEKLKGVAVGILYKVWCWKTRMVDQPKGEKSLRIYLLISTEYTNVTDRRTDTARWHRLRLCIASRAKKNYRYSRRATEVAYSFVVFRRVQRVCIVDSLKDADLRKDVPLGVSVMNKHM